MNEIASKTTSATQCDDRISREQYMVPFSEAVTRYLKGFTTDGRASRSELWWAMLFVFVLSGGITALLGGTVFSWIFTIIFLILDVCIWWRRMHDLGETGLWSLVPFYNLYLAMKPSMLKENQYGTIPNPRPIFVKMSRKIIITAIFVISLALSFSGENNGGKIPVSQYIQRQIDDIGQEVASQAKTRPNIVEIVERKHGTVTVKNVQIKHYSIQTIDGGNVVQNDGSNIFEHKLVLRFWWDGIIHADGHTDIGFIINKDGKCVKAWTDDTDALIDLDDPEFWYDVGVALGSMLEE